MQRNAVVCTTFHSFVSIVVSSPTRQIIAQCGVLLLALGSQNGSKIGGVTTKDFKSYSIFVCFSIR